jgi:WD40-like Beta Propeller Repeat
MTWVGFALGIWFVLASVIALLAVGIGQAFGRSSLGAGLRIAAVVYAVMALLGIGWIVWQEQPSPTPGLERSERLFAVLRNGTGLRRVPRDHRGPTFASPSRPASARRSGKQWILSWPEPGGRRRVSVRLGALGDPGYLRWSPGHRVLMFGAWANGGDQRFHLYTVPAVGGRPRRITGEVLDEPAAWSPDGRWIAAADYHDDIELIRPNGTDEHTLLHLSGGVYNPLAGDYTVNFRDLRWSADGRRLTFIAARVPPES